MFFLSNTHKLTSENYRRIQSVVLLCTFFLLCATHSYSLEEKTGEASTSTSNEELLNQYIMSKSPAISFDSTNIKQFWVDNSVVSKDNSIVVILDKKESNSFESKLLKIQLANVNEEQTCNVEVLSNNSNALFSVCDNNGVILTNSQGDGNFIDYYVSSLSFNLEDTSDLTFNLKFQSSSSNILSIEKIILSFPSDQKKYIKYNKHNLRPNSTIAEITEKTFSITEKNKTIYSIEKITVNTNPLKYSLKIKNVGDVAANIYFGFSPYSKDDVLLNERLYPYNNTNKVLNVVSSTEQSNTIIVDSYPEWRKNCRLALGAKDDMSDIPNNSWTEGKIIDVKKIDDNRTEITLDEPLTKKLEKGEKVRINGSMGASICPIIKKIQPDEEMFFNGEIKKDMSEQFFSHEHFSRDIDYVIPLLIITSSEPQKECTIQISNFRIGF